MLSPGEPESTKHSILVEPAQFQNPSVCLQMSSLHLKAAAGRNHSLCPPSPLPFVEAAVLRAHAAGAAT